MCIRDRATQEGNTVYFAGVTGIRADKSLVQGKVGRDLTTQQGYDAAKLAAGRFFSTVDALGLQIDDIVQVLYVRVHTNATDDFDQHTKVSNGFCDAVVEVLGERGKAARMSIGAPSLPNNKAVNVEITIAVKPGVKIKKLGV